MTFPETPRGTEVKGVMPNYISFLMGRLIEIWQAWDGGDPEFALRKTCRLTIFLPRDLKEKLREDLLKITRAMNQAYNISGSDFFLTHLRRNRKGREVATILLPPFLDTVVDLLDERGYLEKTKQSVPMGRELNY